MRRQDRDDFVVVAGDALYGLRVTEIIDLTADADTPQFRGEREKKWWEHAQCRVKPTP